MMDAESDLSAGKTRLWSVSAAVAVMGLAATSQAQCVGRWTQVATSGPPPCSATAMGYDSVRDRVVLFTGTPAETWEWDGVSWTRRSTSGPSVRLGSRMAFDAARQRMVLFGGAVESGASSVFHNDTWTWDGNVWTLAATTGPGPRRAHAMAYDPVSQTVIMHGGAITQPSLSYYQDTWAWNGSAWQQRSTPNVPSPRDWHTMAFDPSLGEVVMFGGLFTPPTQGFDTTFHLGSNGWTQIPSFGPSPRGTQAMCLDTFHQSVIMFGGLSLVTGNLGDTWVFDGATWNEIASSGPEARQHVMMAFDEASDQTVLFGGSTSSGGVQGDTWVWTYSICGDYNCDGIIDFFDYLDFVDVFSNNGPGADFNGDTVVDFFDYLDFVDAFSTGC